MTDQNPPVGDAEVQDFVPSPPPNRHRVGWVVVVVVSLLIGGVVVHAATRSGSRAALAPRSLDSTPSATETTLVVDTVVDAIIDTQVDTVAPTVLDTAGTAGSVGKGATSGSSSSGGNSTVVTCAGTAHRIPVKLLIPNLVGENLFEATTTFQDFYWYQFCTGQRITFEIDNTPGTCTTNPALFDRYYEQSPAPGTPFSPGAVRLDVSSYQNCATTTTLTPQTSPPASPASSAAPTTTAAPPSTTPST